MCSDMYIYLYIYICIYNLTRRTYARHGKGDYGHTNRDLHPTHRSPPALSGSSYPARAAPRGSRKKKRRAR